MSDKNEQPQEEIEAMEPTDSPETLETDAADIDPPEVEDNASQSPAKTGRPLALAALAVSVLALAGVGAGGWLVGQQAQQGSQAQGELAAQVASLSTQVQALQTQTAPLTQLQTDLARVDTAQAQVLQTAAEVSETSKAVSDQLQTFVDDLADTRTRIELIEGNRAQEYLLAEVEYLLRIAVQRIQAGRDIATGLSLMQAADQSLASADDAALFPVRRALASEIASLRSVPSVDRNGMYLALSAASDQVARLSIGHQEMADAPQADADAQGQVMKTLSSFITIRSRENAIQPLMSPAEEVYARQNLRLMMEQAQLAVLAGNQTAWQASLERAADWTQTHFEADSVSESIAQTLSELADRQIAPEIPSVGAALTALKAVQNARDAALGGN